MEILISKITPIISSFGILGVAILLIYKEFRSGTSSLQKQITTEYKERNAQLDEKIKALEAESHANSLQIAELKGTLTAKDEQIEKLTAILQGRNPEIIKVLGEIKTLNQQIIAFMRDMHTKTEKTLGYQTKILEKGSKRNEEIDKASKLHIGEPTRIPVDKINEIEKTT